MMPVFTGRKATCPLFTTKTPSFSSPFWRGAPPLGSPSEAWSAEGSTTFPSLLTSRTTTAWMGTASTFSFLLVVMSAVALRPERSEGGGSFRVTVTLKSLAWFAVLVVELVEAAVWPRGMAEEPISVTSPLSFTPSSASTRISAGCPRVT